MRVNKENSSFLQTPNCFTSRHPQSSFYSYEDDLSSSKSFRSIQAKNQSQLLCSIDIQSYRQKQNEGGYNTSVRKDKVSRSRARQNRLKNMRRYHSQKLLRQFTRQIESISNNDYQGNDVQQKIQKLQGAVKGLIFVKELIQNPQKGKQQIGFDHVKFSVGTIIDNYQFKLNQKDKQIRELKRKLQYFSSLNQEQCQQHELENKYYLEIPDLQKSFGSSVLKKSFQNSLSNSRQSFRGIDILPVISQRLPPNIKQIRKNLKQSIDDQLLIQDEFIIHTNLVSFQAQLQQEEPTFQQHIQNIELQKIDEKQQITSRCYEESVRFDSQRMTPAKVNQSIQIIPQRKLEIFKLQSINIQKLQTNINNSNQYKNDSSCYLNDQTKTNKQLNLSIRTLQLGVDLKESKTSKILTQQNVLQLLVFDQNQALPSKTHKEMIKITVDLLTHFWKGISKNLKFCQTKQQKLTLTQARQKLIKFTDQFNKTYKSVKFSKKISIQEFESNNIKELKEIQQLLLSIASKKS